MRFCSQTDTDSYFSLPVDFRGISFGQKEVDTSVSRDKLERLKRKASIACFAA